MGSRQRGFTLIELMIVVAIVAILAAVAIPAFFKYIKKSKSSEVPAMFAELKLKQEQYAVENSAYLSTGPDEATMHPATPAGSRDPVSINPLPVTWQTLRINPPKSNVYCSYVSIAGTGGSLAGVGAEAAAFGMTTAPVPNWYYLLARCDWDDNAAQDSYYFSRSDMDGIAKRNPNK